MTDRVFFVGLAISLLLLGVVLELIRRRKLAEEYAFIWILFALLLLLLAIRRTILDTAARWLGIYYPPILLVLVVILMFFVASLVFAVVVSRQRRQIDKLIEDMAVLSAEIRELRAGRRQIDRPENLESRARPR